MHSGLPTQEHARCVRGIVYFNKQNTRVKRAKHRHLGVCVVGTEKLRTSRPQFMGAFLKSRPQTPEKLLSPPAAVFHTSPFPLLPPPPLAILPLWSDIDLLRAATPPLQFSHK